MAAAVVMNRADDGQLIHHLGLVRHCFAELNSDNIGVDRTKWSAVLGWCLWFGIVCFELSWAAGQLDEDDRGLALLHAGLRAVRQDVSQRQRAKSEKADTKK